MPSGAKKRKAAKKKKVIDSTSSSTTHSNHGESDGGELISPATPNQQNPQHPFTEGEAVEVEKREDNSFKNKSIAKESSEKMQKEEEGNIEIERGIKSKKSHNSSLSSSTSSSDDESNVVEKKVVVLEPVPGVESVQPIESLIEKKTDKVQEVAMETSSIVDTVKPHDDTKLEEKKDLVMEVAPPMAAELDKNVLLAHKVIVNESDSKDTNSTSNVVVESVLKENEEEKSKASSESVSGMKGTDRVYESEMPEYSERQPLVASAPRTVETTSWKSCCGMLDLFSGSER